MQRLLDICEQWSLDFGKLFAPQKCFVVAKMKTKVTLYDKVLPQKKEATYLGLEFSHLAKILAQLETMQTRNEILHARYMGRLWNQTDPTILTSLLVKKMGRDQLKIIPHLKDKMFLIEDSPEPNQPLEALPKSAISQYKQKAIKEAQVKGSKIGKAIRIPEHRLGNLVQNSTLPREKNRAIILWRLGRIAFHQKCRKCRQELSRSHALQCTGHSETILRKYRFSGDSMHTSMDQRLNQLDCSQPPPPDQDWIEIAEMIQDIQFKCLGHEPAGIG
jgi:hypothetical protein